MKVADFDKYKQESATIKQKETTIILRLFSFLSPYWIWAILAIFLVILARAVDAWVPFQLGRVAQEIFVNKESGEDKNILFNNLIIACFYIFILSISGYLLDLANIIIKNWIGQKAIFKLRTAVYNHIQKFPMSYYDQTPIGRLITRTIYDVDQINQLFSESIIPLIGSLILFIGITIAVFFLNWEVGLLFCFIVPLLAWLVNHFRVNQRKGYNAIHSIISAMNSFVQEHLMGFNIIRSFGLEKDEKKKFNEMNKDHLNESVKTVRYFAFFFSGIELLQNFTMIGVFLLLMQFSEARNESFQIGTFFTISIYSLMIFRPLLDLAERYNILQAAMASAERIFETLDLPEESIGPQPGLPLEEINSIIFDDVWFEYEKNKPVLKGLSFTINKGESVAIVGVTGSGKTSIINLLLRFYEFQKGKILINGNDIRHYSTASLRSQFSVILQDPVIFSGTILDNITLYNPTISLEDVEEGSNYVNLTPVVERFSDGFYHILKERGSTLSTGEMQLISLARVMAQKRNALVFDEATANIDMHTDQIIQEALKKILSCKTALIIAHRLSTIKDASKIIVLSQGKVAESGSHEELLSAKGVYEKLVHLQFNFSE